MPKPKSQVPYSLDRRTFLQSSALAAAGWASGVPLLSGCGDDDTPPASVASTLTVDPNVPWWLQNGYAPVFDELVTTDLPVRGTIPPELNGLYVRNGSNPQNSDSPHWFFGDGMVHGVRLENGRPVWYRNRYVDTPLYQQGLPFGGDLAPTGGNNQSNVSTVYHGGRLLTSGEVGFPYEIDPSDLSTKGVHNFRGRLNTSFTAHPKIDPGSGMMHAFGYWFLPPYLTYHVMSTSGAIVHSQAIEVAQPTMIHSFAITESDVIFWELPVVFSLEAALAGADNPFSWDPSYGSRVGVMPLGGDGRDIRWVEIENCYVFHEVNAFRDGDDVVIDLCRHGYMFADERFGDAPLALHRWRIGTGGSALTFRDEVLIDDELELPSHDRRFSGRRHRFGWLLDNRENDATVDLGGIVRVDFDTGAESRWEPGSSRHANEAFFVPSGDGEGEGWLLSYVYDHVADRTDLAILDARRVADGPVAEIRMPRRVPHGFHGVWIPD